jgi:hypothetical protein
LFSLLIHLRKPAQSLREGGKERAEATLLSLCPFHLLLEILRVDRSEVLHIALELIVVHAVELELVNAQNDVVHVRNDFDLDVHWVVPEVERVLPGIGREHITVLRFVGRLNRNCVHGPELVLDDHVGGEVLDQAATVHDNHPELMVFVPVVVLENLAAVPKFLNQQFRDVAPWGIYRLDALETGLAASDEKHQQHGHHDPGEVKREVSHHSSFSALVRIDCTDFQCSLRTPIRHEDFVKTGTLEEATR